MIAREPPAESAEITLLLQQASRGDSDALARVYALVYDELRSLAAAKLRFERQDHTLNATALVHEAYLRLAGQTEVEWQSRSHFYAVAAQAMRRILVDHARRRAAGKRQANLRQVALERAEAVPAAASPFSEDQADRLLALDLALTRLGEFNPRGARVVEYRFFGGLHFREIAEVLGLSEVTARRSWTVSKLWLRRQLGAHSVFGDTGVSTN